MRFGFDHFANVVANGGGVVGSASVRDLERVAARIFEKDCIIALVRVRNLRAFNPFTARALDDLCETIDIGSCFRREANSVLVGLMERIFVQPKKTA